MPSPCQALMASKTNKTSSLRSGENTVSSPEMAFSLDWGMCVIKEDLCVRGVVSWSLKDG